MVVPRTRKAIGLMLTGPLLVAVLFALLALGAPPVIMIPLSLLAWFGGPVLFVVGAAMLWSKGQWTMLPSTRPGRLSLWLVVAFATFFFVFFLALAAQLGPGSREQFFDNLYLAIPFSLAGACAVAAGVLAGYAALLRQERSLLVVGSLAFGAVVAVFTATEIGGHEESGGTAGRQTPVPSLYPNPPNGHSNVTVANVAPGEVRVSFDYVYSIQAQGIAITGITVSALGTGGRALADYEPVVRSIDRGSGHIDVMLPFTPEQLALLKGFSICFTAPGQPDLGCATTGYGPN